MATIAALREVAPGETRVALTPAVTALLVKDGETVIIEKGAGVAAGYPDADYVAAGASIGTRTKALGADAVAVIARPAPRDLAKFKQGQVLLGLLDTWNKPEQLDALTDRGVHALCFCRLPRQISRAQTMDALSSQASIAGYRAAIVAATAYGRYLPMMVTAAGTAKPSSVLVLGAGVAGLQAIATARRLGARVTGYDVRPEAREEVASLGAAFLGTSVDAVGEGGYARELTPDEAEQQRAELATAIAGFDIVITTAQVPGRRPPVLIEAATVEAMRRGSVIVDLAAGKLGGNVAGIKLDTWELTPSGVTLIAAGDLPQQMAPAASDAYARNVRAVLTAIISDGAVHVDLKDDVIGAMAGEATNEEAAA